MITANTIHCTSAVDPPNYVEFVSNWMTTVTCEMPPQTYGWPFWIEVAVAIGTVSAVAASIMLSFIARREASRLEFFRRELDRYEELRGLLAQLPYTVSNEPTSMAADVKKVEHITDIWHVYARTRHEKLADTWFSLVDILEGVGLTLATVNSEGILRVAGYEAEQRDLAEWVDRNFNYESEYQKDINVFLDHLAAFYAGATRKRVPLEDAHALKAHFLRKYEAHLAYFKARSASNRS